MFLFVEDPPVPPTPASGDIGAEEVSVAFEPRQILSNGEKVRLELFSSYIVGFFVCFSSLRLNCE